MAQLTKLGLAKLFQDNYGSGKKYADVDSKFDERDIMNAINLVSNKLMFMEFVQNRNEGVRQLNGYYYLAYPNQEIKHDSVRDIYFVDLPVRPITIPNDEGVQGMYPVQDMLTPMVKQKIGQQAVFKNLEAASAGFNSTYYIENLKIIFTQIKDDHKRAGKVLLLLAPSFEAYGDEEALPIPSGREWDILDAVRDFFIGKLSIPEDRVNDNAEEVR